MNSKNKVGDMMDNFSTLNQILERKLQSLIDNLFSTMPKPQRDFYLDMIYGILRSKSLLISDISRELNEDKNLIQTIKRLNTNISKYFFDNIKITNLANLFPKENHSITLFVDDTDIIKPYGIHFEALGSVRDGSSIKKEYEKGYINTVVVAETKEHKHPVVIKSVIHSTREKYYKSVNTVLNKILIEIFTHFKNHNLILVFDRGYDDGKLFKFIGLNKRFFIIRLKNTRHLYYKNKAYLPYNLANKTKGKYSFTLKIGGENVEAKVSHKKIKVSNDKRYYNVIFSYFSYNQDPFILITNLEIHSKNDIEKIILSYFSRWKIEEYFRVIKTEYNYEGMRIRNLKGLNNLANLLHLSMGFMALIIEEQTKNLIYSSLISIAKPLKTNTYFKYYQISDGLEIVLKTKKIAIKNIKKSKKPIEKDRNLFNI